MSSALVVKMEAPNYSSNGIVNAFKDHYDHVYEMDWQSIRFNTDIEGVRKRLMAMVTMYSPDVCFLHIQIEGVLDENTLDFLNEQTFTVIYTFDVRADIGWYMDLSAHIGLILFGDMPSVSQCHADGIMNVCYLGCSADFDLYKPTPNENNYGEIIFIGNNFLNTNHKFELSQQRVDMVKYMKDAFGERFKVYGLNWDGAPVLQPKEEIEAYSSCKISICHNNFLRDGYTSDRLYRSLGCGAFTINHAENFDKALWFVPYWSNFDDLKRQCDFWLEYDDVRKSSAAIKREYLIRHHSWYNRIEKLKQLVSEHTSRSVAY